VQDTTTVTVETLTTGDIETVVLVETNWSVAGLILPFRKEQNVVPALVISLTVKGINVGAEGPSPRGLPKRISFERHSSFSDLTHLSVCGFRLGLRAVQ
jgi:hypothetical protein